MSAIDQAIDLLKLHEGFRNKPYLDTTSRMTVGFGRNLQDKGVTVPEAEILLRNDVMEVATQLTALDWFSTLSDTRQAVLLDMAVNMGFAGLMKFHDMIAAIRGKDYNAAANAMLESRWAAQLPTRANELAGMMRNAA